MQRALIVVVGAALVAAAGPLAAQGSRCARTPAEAEQQVRRIEAEWIDAFRRSDPTPLERILADDFVAISGAADVGKAEFLAVIRRVPQPAPAVTVSDERYRVLGDVVLATGASEYATTPPMRQRYSELFVCRDGRWQVVHGHYTDLPPASADSADPRAARSDDGGRRDSVVVAAETAQRADRGAEARAILERAASRTTAGESRLHYRALVGDSHLYDGDLAGARAAYAAVLRDATAARVDSMANWAHYGMALADAFAGRARDAEAHLAQSLRLGGWTGTDSIVDKIMVYAAAGRTEPALALLASLEASGRREPGTAGSPQFVHAFRGYALARSGRCDEALRALDRAPQQDRPLIHAVRATCAAKAGRRDEALAARDRVLDSAPAEPFAWPYLIARHVARQVR